ncbi:MAG: type II secretion system protein [Parcubacteria group bacterium]|nr:type II secretion system protein [Parcubacteria group bacterium]
MAINKSKIAYEDGYTLIELMVAMTLFVIAFSLVSGAFVEALRTQRQIVAFIAANNNMALFVEQFSRETRTGINFISLGSELQFTNAKGEEVSYRLSGTRVERGVGGSFMSITSQNVNIKNLQFIITQPAGFPPRITVTVSVNPVSRGLEKVLVNMQATLSPRILF